MRKGKRLFTSSYVPCCVCSLFFPILFAQDLFKLFEKRKICKFIHTLYGCVDTSMRTKSCEQRTERHERETKKKSCKEKSDSQSVAR